MLYSVSPQYAEDFPALAEVDVSAVADDNPYKEDIATWKTYALYLYQFCMALQMVDQIIDKSVKDAETKAKIKKAVRALYTAAGGVQKAFLQGIDDMEAGKKPEYHFDPVPVPPWPDPEHPQSFFQSIWNFARPILEQVVSQLAEGSPFATAVVGMINCGDEVVRILDGVTLPLTMEH